MSDETYGLDYDTTKIMGLVWGAAYEAIANHKKRILTLEKEAVELRAENERLRKERGTCKWELDSDGAWQTECGEAWYMSNEYGPKDNDMNFCPCCGKILVVESKREG